MGLANFFIDREGKTWDKDIKQLFTKKKYPEAMKALLERIDALRTSLGTEPTIEETRTTLARIYNLQGMPKMKLDNFKIWEKKDDGSLKFKEGLNPKMVEMLNIIGDPTMRKKGRGSHSSAGRVSGGVWVDKTKEEKGYTDWSRNPTTYIEDAQLQEEIQKQKNPDRPMFGGGRGEGISDLKVDTALKERWLLRTKQSSIEISPSGEGVSQTTPPVAPPSMDVPESELAPETTQTETTKTETTTPPQDKQDFDSSPPTDEELYGKEETDQPPHPSTSMTLVERTPYERTKFDTLNKESQIRYLSRRNEIKDTDRDSDFNNEVDALIAEIKAEQNQADPDASPFKTETPTIGANTNPDVSQEPASDSRRTTEDAPPETTQPPPQTTPQTTQPPPQTTQPPPQDLDITGNVKINRGSVGEFDEMMGTRGEGAEGQGGSGMIGNVLNQLDSKNLSLLKHQKDSIESLKKRINLYHELYDRDIPSFRTKEHQHRKKNALKSKSKGVVLRHLDQMEETIKEFFKNAGDLKMGIIISADSMFNANSLFGGSLNDLQLSNLQSSIVPASEGGTGTDFSQAKSVNPQFIRGGIDHAKGNPVAGVDVNLRPQPHQPQKLRDPSKRREIDRYGNQVINRPVKTTTKYNFKFASLDKKEKTVIKGLRTKKVRFADDKPKRSQGY